jgi:hypothetical protein
MQDQGKWLICGDFNLIYRAEDKSNSRLNRRLMEKFKSLLEELELKELPLSERKFTWMSSQSSQGQATLTQIDKVFYLTEWEELFSHCPPSCMGVYHIRSLPFNFTRETGNVKFKGIRFESYWWAFPSFTMW